MGASSGFLLATEDRAQQQEIGSNLRSKYKSTSRRSVFRQQDLSHRRGLRDKATSPGKTIFLGRGRARKYLHYESGDFDTENEEGWVAGIRMASSQLPDNRAKMGHRGAAQGEPEL